MNNSYKVRSKNNRGNCIECGYKFTIVNRLKIYLNLKGNLICPQCKSVYRDNFNIYRSIYYGLVTFISMMIYFEVNLSNVVLKGILYMIMYLTILILFDAIPHGLHRYKKVDRSK